MDGVAFEYVLTGDGFCDTTFRIGNAQLAAEQLGDSPVALGALVSAALAVARREDHPSRVLWDLEEGSEFRWYLSRNADRLHVQVEPADSDAR